MWNLEEQLNRFKPRCAQEETDRLLLLRYLVEQRDVLRRDNTLAHFTASAWIVNPARTHVLMAYHNIYDSWAWTGGHADGDSNLLAVALREAAEETGVRGVRALDEDIFSLEALCVNPHVKRGVFVSAHIHLNATFLLEAPDDDALRMKPDENSGVRWVPVGEAVALSSEECMKVIYQKLNDRLTEICGEPT